MLTQTLDLRTGTTAWSEDRWTTPASDPLPDTCLDVAIVGAGISGAILAERLTDDGHAVVLLDRRAPGFGSTAASTAQIMWAMDVPFCELAASLGEAEAARRWRRVHAAVVGLSTRIEALGLDTLKQDCPTVYLEGSRLDAAALAGEAALHRAYGLPSSVLDGEEIAARFGIAPRAGIVSGDGFAIEPVRLTHALLERAREKGAILCHPIDVLGLTEASDQVVLRLDQGRDVRAREVVLACGYESPGLFLPPAFRLSSTFVITTAPLPETLWREEAMIWEAADPYLYVRADNEGRIIAGGEDEDLCDPLQRDQLIGVKAGLIQAKLAKLLGTDDLAIDHAWAATFGNSPDGLPAIGLAANMKRVWLAAGYGGNGIAFAALAAEILALRLTRQEDRDAACFDPYRF